MWGWSRSSGGCSAVVFVLGTLEIGPSSMTAANGDTDSCGNDFSVLLVFNRQSVLTPCHWNMLKQLKK